MPLRCINPEGQNIHSFDLSADAWQALLQENKKAKHLKMTCCNAAVVLKRSKLGTQFFAHKAKGMCATAPEREEHLILKQEAVLAARRNGWQANTEVSGRTPDGEEWRADMLAEKGKHKVAVEIQWSGQSNEETVTRQERYKKSGIRCLWLMRQTKFPISRDLPAVCLGGNLERGFTALIPSHEYMTVADRKLMKDWSETIPIGEFLDGVFDGRFHYGLPSNTKVHITIRERTVRCPFCRMKTKIVSPIELKFSKPNYARTVLVEALFFHKQPEVIINILRKIPKGHELAIYKLINKKNLSFDDLEPRCFFCSNKVLKNYQLNTAPDSPLATDLLKSPKIAEFSIKTPLKWDKLFDICFGRYWKFTR
jgi:hypothetical protein